MSTFYIKNEQIEGNKIKIIGEDVNHIKNVLRYKTGDKLNVCDKDGIKYITKIESLTNNSIISIIEEKLLTTTETGLNITLFQAIPKGDKMDMIVQKCTEIGINYLIPVETERVVVKMNEENIKKKIERWNKIALEASKQSGRQKVPVVTEIVNLKNVIENVSKYDIVILPYEMEKESYIKNVLRNINKNKCKQIAIVIGPEGGFSESEVGMIENSSNCNVARVTLGPRIYRTETAAMVTLSLVIYELAH